LLRGNRSNLTHKSHTRNTLYVCALHVRQSRWIIAAARSRC